MVSSASMKRIASKYGAPNNPWSPYNYFYKEKVALYKKVDTKTFFDFMKEVSQQYNNLSAAEKQKYIDLSIKDKTRYFEDMKEFKKSANYKYYIQDMNSKSKINKTVSRKRDTKKPIIKIIDKPKLETQQMEPRSEIPIFTREFLEHNQQREELLRNIKKQANQLEEQTALLSKHLDNLNNAIDQSQKSINKHQEYINTMAKINSILDNGLLTSLSKFKPPANVKQPNLQFNKSNIPLFINALKDVLTSNCETEFISKLKVKMKNFPQFVLCDLKKL